LCSLDAPTYGSQEIEHFTFEEVAFMDKNNTNPPRGMKDRTPKEVELREYVQNKIVTVYRRFGFVKIETPCVENIRFLSSGEGGDNEKMIFKILKRGQKLVITEKSKQSDLVDLGLRYDLTVPLARFYANNREKVPSPFKVMQVGNVWRAERPQKGRFRQFTQCDIDIIGMSSVFAEIDLISATCEALKNIGFSDFKVRINDRRILREIAKLSKFDEKDFGKLFITLDKLGKIGIDGVERELLSCNYASGSVSMFISIISKIIGKKVTTKDIRELVPNIETSILEDLGFVVKNIRNLSKKDYEIEIDLSLVRGMGYYTGQIFEIESNKFSSSIAGGGRYDKMVGKILQSKNEIPACGFSIGFERVVSILEKLEFKIPKTENKIAILFNPKESKFDNLFEKARELRENNIVSIELQRKNLRKQLDQLSKQGFNYFITYESGVISEPRKIEIGSSPSIYG